MGFLDMSSNNPPALSLSLAGIFGDGASVAVAEERESNMEVAEREGSGSGGRTTMEISSENSGAVRSQSDDDDNEEEDNPKKKKRKKYHRHTAQQIREMEALFKESPHPDEKQRQQLSKQLGLHPRQIKFWFQNRRTQIKAIQERHENSLLKSEIEKLREENKGLRESIKNASCSSCGFTTSLTKDKQIGTEEKQLRMENARLKAEIEKLRASVGKYPYGTSPNSSSCSGGYDQENKSSLEFYNGIFGLEKSRVMDIANQALDELKKMASVGEPLWIKSVESGREILNYDEYMRQFNNVSLKSSCDKMPKRTIEASREIGVVFLDPPRLVQSFMDVNQWKEMFPCIIAKAATVDVISIGEGANGDGAIQLMFAELQMLTPMVSTREVYFIRYCKQLNLDQWAIVDVSIDKPEENSDISLVKCKKRPSGCIIQDKSDGHCKVTWVEHLECHRIAVPSMYRSIVNSGSAFGAKHWMATLQQQCERLVFVMATNIPTKDSSGVATFAGRKSILKLAHRMSWSFCRALGASSFNTWTMVPSKTGDDIRVSSRKNLNDPGEPVGVILCAVSSVWLSVPHRVLFDFLRDETNRDQWDIMLNGGSAQSIANLSKGQDRGNAVSIQASKSNDESMWLLLDSCTNGHESMVVSSPVDIDNMQSVMTGCDSSNLAVLPSGFAILSDGPEQRPSVITSRPEEKSAGGSLLTIAFQILTSNSPTSKLTMESIDSVNSLISCTLQKIKASLQCDDV
ncbi:homeodomain transcription factor [Lithospermum erythrorhizon]|uniref:Homeodomain transcription factor n=1 Tax=Lithospermum erythrorhizon TaxID=34254 RepID=A0AAV3PF69_LITER